MNNTVELDLEKQANTVIKLMKMVKRDIDPAFSDYLSNSDYFTAPSSTKYHGDWAGGLVQHSLTVYKRLMIYNQAFKVGIPHESMIIMSLFHDLCCVDFYAQEMRNKKIDGQWNEVPFYTIEDKWPAPHGAKSVFILQRYMKLLDNEILAISWHMGAYGLDYGSSTTFNNAVKHCEWVLALHTADMQATLIDGI